MKKLWFPAKRYGYGWGFPVAWQGWVVLLGYVAILVWDFMRLDAVSHSNSDTILSFVIDTFVASAILVFIAYKTGEKPRWRWGNEKISG